MAQQYRWEHVAVVTLETDANGAPTIVIFMEEGHGFPQVIHVTPKVETAIIEDRSSVGKMW
jgi:hypothetical protein